MYAYGLVVIMLCRTVLTSMCAWISCSASTDPPVLSNVARTFTTHHHINIHHLFNTERGPVVVFSLPLPYQSAFEAV
jgi:hypothetical protein